MDWSKTPKGIRAFNALTQSTGQTLVREGFLNPEDKQNEAPTAGQILNFMAQYPEIVAHGYVVSPFREDTRITLTGIRVPPDVSNVAARVAALEFCLHADDVRSSGEIYCWWD